MPERVTRAARAKINLALAVAKPRPEDGRHPICSWFAPIDLEDTVEIARLGEEAETEFDVSFAPDALRDERVNWERAQDLCARAHTALEEAAGRSLAARVRVEKRIPTGAGLGGGSSDAAATLLGLREVFELAVDDAALRRIGLALGADVPFFLPPDAGAPAVVEGVGERVARSAAVSAWIALVIPAFGCATGAVYKAYDAQPSGEFRTARVREMAAAGAVDPEALFNDLAAPAMRVEPRLAALVARVGAISGDGAQVTGSGSGVYVVTKDQDDARSLAERVRTELGDVSCRAVRVG